MFFDDNSNLPCNMIIACVTGSGVPKTVSSTDDGNLVSVAQAESMDDDGESNDAQLDVLLAEELSPGKRKWQANTLYNANMFWRQHDDKDPNCNLIT